MDSIVKLLCEMKGWRTPKQIIVFESDDWGALRIPNRGIYDEFKRDNPSLISSTFNNLDTIASYSDLSLIFETFSKIKDINNRSLPLGANFVMTNPKFDEIKSNNFTKYVTEPFYDTIKEHHGENVISLWNQGITNKIVYPQLHGLEHLDSIEWMNLLRSGNEHALAAFKGGFYSFDRPSVNGKTNLTAALSYFNSKDQKIKSDSVILAQKKFVDFFGYKSKSFIAPSYTWGKEIERSLASAGVTILQGIKSQKVPMINENNKYTYKYNYLGKKNSFGQVYLVRNAFFEPHRFSSLKLQKEHLYNRVKYAFLLNRPVIMSSHRLNFVGGINVKNRDNNLLLLSEVFAEIKRKWPKVEFMTSEELGNLILQTSK